MHITCSSIFKNSITQVLQHICGRFFKKKPFSTLGKWKMVFLFNKKTSFVNIVHASKVHVCVEYGPIKINYAMYLSITPVSSTQTVECQEEIALFCEQVFNRTVVFQVYYYTSPTTSLSSLLRVFPFLLNATQPWTIFVI